MYEKRKEVIYFSSSIQNYLSAPQPQTFIFTPFIKTNLSDKPINLSPQINIFSQLRNDGKFILNEWGKHIENNLCMYCGEKSYRVKVCPFYPSETTRFQARHVEAISSVMKVNLIT